MNFQLAQNRPLPSRHTQVPEEPQDKDSLHILPLSSVPLITPGLQRARLIKNSRLEGMVELFSGTETGSGQIAPEDLPSVFQFNAHNKKDMQLVKTLSRLSSYDVYSLRVELRRLGIEIDSHRHLRLSDAKVRELSPHMRAFTRPLLAAVYGDSKEQGKAPHDLVHLFMDPDAAAARRNLSWLAGKLKIAVTAIPKFLEDYGDVYLSLAYYQYCLEQNMARVAAFLKTLGELRKNPTIKQDHALVQIFKDLDEKLRSIVYEVTEILEMFRLRTADMWDDMSAESFRAMEDMIIGYQTQVGAALCAVTVKMNAWSERFPSGRTVVASKQIDFIVNDIRLGFQGIRSLHG